MTEDSAFKLLYRDLLKYAQGYKIYENRAPTPAELTAEDKMLAGEFVLLERWLNYLEKNKPDAKQKSQLVAATRPVINILEQLMRAHSAITGNANKVVEVLKKIESIPSAGGPTGPIQPQVVEIGELEKFLKEDYATFVNERQDTVKMEEAFKRSDADVTNLVAQEKALADQLVEVQADLNNALIAIRNRNFQNAFPFINDAFNKLNYVKTLEGTVKGEIAKLKDIFVEDQAFSNRLIKHEQEVENVTRKMETFVQVLRNQILETLKA
jgi:hypothetical protein